MDLKINHLPLFAFTSGCKDDNELFFRTEMSNDLNFLQNSAYTKEQTL